MKTIEEYMSLPYRMEIVMDELEGGYVISYPDLPGCISEGKTLGNAMYMAQRALTQWIEYQIDLSEPVPDPSLMPQVELSENEFVNLIRADIKDSRAIKRTVSIPKWMDDQAVKSGLSLSRIL